MLAHYTVFTNLLDETYERAVFYGRCFVFEDLLYGIKESKREYVDKSLEAFSWMCGH